jgi:hypothetical protein
MDAKLNKKDVAKALFVSLFENIGLRTFLVFVRFFSIFSLKKKRNDWGKIQRFEHNKEPVQG